VELSKAPIVTFNIFINARYQQVKVVGDEAGLQSLIAGLGKSIKKLDVLSFQKECRMLAQTMC
jgi:oxalate decarboxylase/phosphoglucose isomerase-like protein (cupin superfamily)